MSKTEYLIMVQDHLTKQWHPGGTGTTVSLALSAARQIIREIPEYHSAKVTDAAGRLLKSVTLTSSARYRKERGLL